MSELFKNSPAKDVERNVKAMLSQGFSKLDLVTREEFDTQTQVLVRTRARLEELEARVAELEQRLPVTAERRRTDSALLCRAAHLRQASRDVISVFSGAGVLQGAGRREKSCRLPWCAVARPRLGARPK